MKHAKLWKRILHEGITVGSYSSISREESNEIEIATLSSPLFLVDSLQNVDTIQEDYLEHHSNWDGNFPPIAMPFPSIFIEYHHPYDGMLLGNLVRSHKIENGDRIVIDVIGTVSDAFFGFGNDSLLSNPCSSPHLIGRSSIEIISGIPNPNSMIHYALFNNDYYRVMDWLRSYHPSLFAQFAKFNAMMTDENVQYFVAGVLSFLLTLSCSNVGIALRDPDPKQVRIARKRYGDFAHGYRYHVLVLRDGHSSDGGNSDGEEIGIMPLHSVRGHIRHLPSGEYTIVRPYMRGNPERGRVFKDYEIRAS